MSRDDDRLISLVLTAFTLVVSGVVWSDMYRNGALAALPRAAAALAFFWLFRWIMGRSAKPAPAAEPEEEEAAPTATPTPAPAPAPQPAPAPRSDPAWVTLLNNVNQRP